MPAKRTTAGDPRLEKRTDSPNWQIRFYCPERRTIRYVSTGTRNREIAEAALADFQARQSDEPATSPVGRRSISAGRPDDPRLFEILDAYWEEHAQFLESSERSAYSIRRIKEGYGDIPVSAIDADLQIEYATARWWDGVSAATISTEVSSLRAALNRAVNENLVARAPKIYDIARGGPRTRWLTEDEFRRLLNACADPRHYHVYLYCLLALSTAGRPGAILNLRWEQIDFDAGVVFLNPAHRGQTDKTNATVPLTRQLREALQVAYSVRETDYVIEWAGYPINSIKKAFRRATERAGLEDVTPYTLRHTAATWMAKRGISLWKIACYLGHADTRMVERTYAHHHPSFNSEASHALEDGLGDIEARDASQMRPKKARTTARRKTPETRNPRVSPGVSVVGAAGIEPATPAMSTQCSPAELRALRVAARARRRGRSSASVSGRRIGEVSPSPRACKTLMRPQFGAGARA